MKERLASEGNEGEHVTVDHDADHDARVTSIGGKCDLSYSATIE